MSGFLSTRYLKYLEPPGSQVKRDELVAGSLAEQRRLRAGLAIAALCVCAAAIARLLAYFAGFNGLGRDTRVAYAALGLALSLPWCAAAWALTPRRLGIEHPPLRTVQRLVRFSQILWPIACAAWLIAILRDDDALHQLGLVLRLLAGAGVLFLAWELWWLAERAERENAARRLNAFIWLIWAPTLLAQAFPSMMQWWGLVPLGFVLGAWAWVMLLLAAALLELHRHVRWSMSHAASETAHNQRVAEIRRAHDERIRSAMRPLPTLPPDLPLTD